jgi:hypothetical protein
VYVGPDPRRYEVICYRQIVGAWGDLDEARVAAEEHILNCPEGAMPWANSIRWHHVVIDNDEIWVSACGGEWLNHRIHAVDLADGAPLI